ncbi:MAG: hypothetical protein ACKPJJ_27985, partial [Planctomycetaceae bacterium]
PARLTAGVLRKPYCAARDCPKVPKAYATVSPCCAVCRAGASGRGGGLDDDGVATEDSEQGRRISAAMLEYWVTFMRDGRPAGKDLPEWPVYTSAAPRTMVFGNSSIVAR